MRIYLSVILLLIASTNIFSADITSILNKIGHEPSEFTIDGDSVLDYNGIPIVIRTENGEVNHVGRKLFADGFRQINDNKVLDYVEAAYLNYLLKLNDRKFANITFEKGNWGDMSSVDDSTSCSVTIINHKKYSIGWNDDIGNFINMVFPIEYDKFQRTTNRTEIEDDFIKSLSNFKPKRFEDKQVVDIDKLEAICDSIYMLNGESYTIASVRDNLYYKADERGEFSLLYDANYVVESLANMFVKGYCAEDSVTVDMSILRHEYGKKQSVSVELRQLIEYCKSQGCKPFWGVETMTDDTVKGTLFMYNQDEGYDHVFRIECPINDMTKGQMKIKARVSLYVPTNNVNNLFEQYEYNDDENDKKPKFEVK